MVGRFLLSLLAVSAAARAERSWVFEPDQALVSVEVRGLSAVSRSLSGSVRELDGGAVQVEVRLPLASFVADRPVPAGAGQDPEVVFEGAATRPGKDGVLRLRGTLSFHGAIRALEFPATLVRAGGMAFSHATLVLHLRDFGFAVPQGASDEARVQIDAGLRPEGVLASRG